MWCTESLKSTWLPWWNHVADVTNVQKQTLFLIITFAFALSRFSDVASKSPFLWKDKGSWFGVCFVRTKRKPLGTREGIFCQACSAGATQSLSLALRLSFHTRAETSKRTVPWCASNKSSLPNFILFWICVWITLELQIKICWTLRVRSWGIDHHGFQRSLLV